jgi:hypothetical protein
MPQLKKYKKPIILALLYWVPATIHLFTSPSPGSNTFLVPGCILGFVFGYGGNMAFAFFGQLLNLLVLILAAKVIFMLFRNKQKHQ